jgi:hypothetical protein
MLMVSFINFNSIVHIYDLYLNLSNFEFRISGPGGLFDFNATLPCDSILLLTVVLNIVLYSPLLTIIEERKEYILTNLGKASE